MLRSLPLFMTYIVFPVVAIAAMTAGYEQTFRNWIDIVWFVVAVLALLGVIARGNVLLDKRHQWPLAIVIFSIVCVVLIRFGSSLVTSRVTLSPYFMELKPFFYLAVAAIWVAAFANLDREDFLRYGAWLGVIIIADTLFESLLAGQFVRPKGSGEVNYDACLLLISLCAALGGNAKKKILVALIFVGLLFTFSRTALLSAVFIIFMFSRINVRNKLILAALSLAFMITSYLLRDLAVESIESIDRYWMWISGIRLFYDHPWQAVIGFPAGVALPVEVPDALEWLWSSQQERLFISGVYPFSFHAFWLRLAITWGLVVTLLALTVLTMIILKKRLPVFFRSMALLILLEGLTMGLFYLSNVAVPLLLAIFVGMSESTSEEPPRYGQSTT